jgi:hypothetical protein
MVFMRNVMGFTVTAGLLATPEPGRFFKAVSALPVSKVTERHCLHEPLMA